MARFGRSFPVPRRLAVPVTPAVIPPGTVVNQWAASTGPGTTFGTLTGPLQSCVVQLTSAFSVGGGTGVPSAGSWLFAAASWTQDPGLAAVHIGVNDDARDWWRQYPASSPSGATRTAVAYTANIGSPPGVPLPSYVYVAPDGQAAALTVLVVEVAGLGPWDTVAAGAPVTGYAAAATSLALSLGAPAQPSFLLAAAGGDSTAAGQALAPAGWTALHTVSQSDGTDQAASSCLTCACLASSSAAQDITVTATTATDLSGFLLAVYMTGPDPIPAGHNPDWPLLKFEAAFGSGYSTAVSEMTWTDLTSRLWDWDERTGVQFQLGQLQATQATAELDNYDGALTSTNTGSPYYPDVLPGVPVRIRAAVGTAGGVTVNRWYVITRNASEWTEKIGEDLRRYVEVTCTDVWAALSATPPSTYRAQVYASAPYAWWPCDDQPGTSGVLPLVLHNAAPGNSNDLAITVAPLGASAQDQYDTTGAVTSLGGGDALGGTGGVGGGCAVYTIGASAGWMFGDPPSAPSSEAAAAGNPVTASPGSASWQAAGQYGNTGSHGWFLSCNDISFPPLSAGITVEGWFTYPFLGSGSGLVSNRNNTVFNYTWSSQPATVPFTLIEVATGTGPVAVLQLDTSGHLNLITYNGSAGTSHSIYAASDLRADTWFMITLALTETTWNVQVNGGATVNVSGTATGMTSAWDWLIINGDLGSSGGSAAGTGLVHGGNMAFSHLAVYPRILPYYEIMGHYWAAVTAGGQIPAPSAVQFSPVINTQLIGDNQQAGVTLTADGSLSGGYYGLVGTNDTDPVVYALSAVITAGAGGYTSGPSAWAVQAGGGQFVEVVSEQNIYDGYGVYVSWTGVAASFKVYTASQVKAELNAATVTANSDSFEEGYGSGATGFGPGQTAAGTGTAFPAAPSAVGDTVAQRIERLMQGGRCYSPARCIDPAPLLVQAPGEQGGGVQAGAAIQAIQQSDSGLLYVDPQNCLTYWQRPHLAAQSSAPAWQLGTGPGEIPYWRETEWPTDPQKIINAITVAPLSPTGAALPEYTPSDASSVQSSQALYGAQPWQVTSWLQDTTKMQAQADWLFTTWGTPRRRADNVKADAASHPAAWPLVLAASPGDVATVRDWQPGGGGTAWTYRVTGLRRHIEFGGPEGRETVAAVWLTCDYEPTSYFS